MKLVTSQQMREIDRRTIKEHNIAGSILMDRAGLGVAHAVQDILAATALHLPKVHLVAGRGNNGGDAFVAARYLTQWGVQAELWLAADRSLIKGDALHHFQFMQKAGVPIRDLPEADDWDQLPRRAPSGQFLLVDGLLGTGITGGAHGTAAAAIRYINAIAVHNVVVAIDAPSGLDTDTGAAPGEVVHADLTVTMACPKTGLVQPGAVDYVGTIEVVDIGVPDTLMSEIQSDAELITPQDLQSLFPRRSRASHKGTYGHLLIVAGATGYAGAAAMCARAAIRSGVGLVSVVVPDSVAAVVASSTPEAMIRPAAATPIGSLAASTLEGALCDLNQFNAIVIGPGLTTHSDSRQLVEALLAKAHVPLLLDADALNVLEGATALIAASGAPVVITPHPGEMARLLGRTTGQVQSQRAATARHAAVATQSVVILKGAGTIVASNEHPLQINMTGNPGMASAGSGDVLAGLIGGFLAQDMAPFDAARAGVFLHGHAADRVARYASQAGLTAGDIVNELPVAIRTLSGR